MVFVGRAYMTPQPHILSFTLFAAKASADAGSAQPVCTTGACKRTVCLLPEALRIPVKLYLPNRKYYKRHNKKSVRVKPAYPGERRKHHKVIPVENAACGTALIFHKNRSERAPYNDANQIANVEKHAYQQNFCAVYQIVFEKKAYRSRNSHPNHHDSRSSLIAFTDKIMFFSFAHALIRIF